MEGVRRGALAALLGLAIVLAGCTTSPDAPVPGSPVPGSAAPGSAAPSSAPPSSAAPPLPPATSSPRVGLPTGAASTEPADQPTGEPTRSCADRVLTARTVHLRGARGSLTWDLAVPQLSGAASAAEVNRRVRASAQDAIDLGVRESRDDRGEKRRVEGVATVTTSDRRTVQVELRWTDYLAGTAHPSSYVATTALTTAEGRPLRLRDVLADVPSGLRTIASAVEKEAVRQGEEVTDRSGLAPEEANFAAWQTTGTGMRFSFGEEQLGGRGLRSYTVPWRTVRPLLSDYGTGLLDPDVDPSTC